MLNIMKFTQMLSPLKLNLRVKLLQGKRKKVMLFWKIALIKEW